MSETQGGVMATYEDWQELRDQRDTVARNCAALLRYGKTDMALKQANKIPEIEARMNAIAQELYGNDHS